MKKYWSLLLAALLLTCALNGCGSAADTVLSSEAVSSAESEAASSEQAAPESSSAEAEEEASSEPDASSASSEEASEPEASSAVSEESVSKEEKPASSAPAKESAPTVETSPAESSAESSAAAASAVSAADIYSAINRAFQSKYGHGPIGNSIKLDETTLSEKFHITADMAESYAGCIAGMMTNCDELVVVQAKDGQIDAVKAALQQALNEQNEAFGWYLVMYNGERLDAAKVVVKGNYAALLLVGVSPENVEDEEETVDFSDDVAMAEKAFYSAIG
jgi:DNA mismatch repair ATPase MutL